MRLFTLDTLQLMPHPGGSHHTIVLYGWFIDQSVSGMPQIGVFAGETMLAKLAFTGKRPDVNQQFGKTTYPAGFEVQLSVPKHTKNLRFVLLSDQSVLLTRNISLTDHPDFPFNHSFPVSLYRKLFLEKRSQTRLNLHRYKSFVQHHLLPRKQARSTLQINNVFHAENAYENYILHNSPNATGLQAYREYAGSRQSPVFFSAVVLPSGSLRSIAASIESLAAQTWNDWEVWIPDMENMKLLRPGLLTTIENHLKWYDPETSLAELVNTLCSNTPEGYLLIVEPGACVVPVLFAEASSFLQSQNADLIYFDEDSIDESGKRHSPWFKPEWSLADLLCGNFIGSAALLNKSVVLQSGGINSAYHQAALYELFLRVANTCKAIHLPLTGWHKSRESLRLKSPDAESVAAFRAASETILLANKLDIQMEVAESSRPDGCIALAPKPFSNGPSVDILLFAGSLETTKRCLASLLECTAYQNYHVWIVANKVNEETSTYLRLYQHQKVSFFGLPGLEHEASQSSVVNAFAQYSRADFLLLLDFRVFLTDENWLGSLVVNASLPGRSCAGLLQRRRDGKLRQGRIRLPQLQDYYDFSIIDPACMLFSLPLFKQAGGFGPDFNDINFAVSDFCLRIASLGYQARVVANCETGWQQHEDEADEADITGRISFVENSVAAKKILTEYETRRLNTTAASMRDLPYLRTKALKILFFTHNFNFEGAPKVLYELALGMKQQFNDDVVIASAKDGEARSQLEAAGMETIIFPQPGLYTDEQLFAESDGFPILRKAITTLMQTQKPDLVFVNVLFGFYVVNFAHELAIPAVWMIHESFTRNEVEKIAPHYNHEAYAAAFNNAKAVVFPSRKQSDLYKHLQQKDNFHIIPNALPASYPAAQTDVNERIILRQKLNLPEEKTIVLHVGTTAPHKNQELILQAASQLKQQNVHFVLVGAREGAYLEKLHFLMDDYHLGESVTLIPETTEIQSWYQAADIFCFPSKNETYPLVVLEAMAHGLPLLVSPVNGIGEQVEFGRNALEINPNDPIRLANTLNELVADPQRQKAMGKQSLNIFARINSPHCQTDKVRHLMAAAVFSQITTARLMENPNNDLYETIRMLTRQNLELSQQNQQMSTVLTKMAASSSWRITAPMRLVANGLRQLLGRNTRPTQQKTSTTETYKPQHTLKREAYKQSKLGHPYQNTKKLVFPVFSNPLVTIIIPVYNQWELTMNCLKSVLEHTQDVPAVVMLIDDFSTDETTGINQLTENIIIHRNQQNLGFLRSCNKAAAMCNTPFIHLLNNDTIVQAGWLKSLLDIMEQNPKAGIAGSKFLDKDGKLQEAGGIIWTNATGLNYGRGDDAEAPEYNYLKEVDYVSGASILIRKALWDQLGGFDTIFHPAYFEDTDFAFRTREAGYKVIYQPASVVTHLECGSYGQNPGFNTGVLLEKNRAVFLKRWGALLQKEKGNNDHQVFLHRDRSAQKTKVLLTISHFPESGTHLFNIVSGLSQQLPVDDIKACLINESFESNHHLINVLQQTGIEVIYGLDAFRKHPQWLKENLANFEFIICTEPSLLAKYRQLLTRPNHTKLLLLAYTEQLHGSLVSSVLLQQADHLFCVANNQPDEEVLNINGSQVRLLSTSETFKKQHNGVYDLSPLIDWMKHEN